MADITSQAPKTNSFDADNRNKLTQVLTAPFRALFNGLIALAEAGPRMKQVRKLNALSDEELAARGTTRVEEVRRIFGDQMYI